MGTFSISGTVPAGSTPPPPPPGVATFYRDCNYGSTATGLAVGDYTLADLQARGILNDDQGGPLHPPGVRMAEALGEVRESIQRNLDAKKGGPRRRN